MPNSLDSEFLFPPNTYTRHWYCRSYGGYCYLNSAAIAAKTLLAEQALQKVGVIDVDYHAGNGAFQKHPYFALRR